MGEPIKPPTADQVIQHLLLDADYGCLDFDEFRLMCGYGEDTFRAVDLWERAKETHDAVLQLFSHEEIAEMWERLCGAF